MRDKFRSIVQSNNGCVVRNVKIGDNLYCVKPLKDNKVSLDIIRSLYGDYYINSLMVSPVERTEVGYRKKLDYILDANEKYGFSYWGIFNQITNQPVGLYGFKKIHGISIEKEVDITYMSKLANIIKPLSERIIPFLFENFNIEKLHGNNTSYNYATQIIGMPMGFVQNGIKICDSSYNRDSYLTSFVLTREKYNEIKKLNYNKYVTGNTIRSLSLRNIHCKARCLYVAIKEFKKNNDVKRYKYCKKLYEYRLKKYPRTCMREIRMFKNS